MPNLFSAFPVEMFLWVFGSTSGLILSATWARFVHSSGDLVDDLKFMQRLAVEGKNILFESVFDLFVTLADAGKNDL